MNKHTPTPWHIEYDHDDDSYLEINDGKNEAITTVHPGGLRPIPEDIANACLIIQACNSHAALLAACEDSLSLLKSEGYHELRSFMIEKWTNSTNLVVKQLQSAIKAGEA